LQVNVKEGTEVVPLEHGSGTGFVKNEEIEEMDASNAADEPIQDVMNNCSAESDKEEDRESPVHTTNTFYEKIERVACPSVMYPQHYHVKRKRTM
jgi:hypothetical protein